MAMSRKSKKGRSSGFNQNTRNTGGQSSGFYDRLLGNAMYFSGAIARTGLEYGAEKIQSLAGLARTYSEEQVNTPQIQEYAELAADSLDDLAAYVSDTDIEVMLEDARDFAYRHPWAVVSAGLVGGVLAAQVLRTSMAGSARSGAGWTFASGTKPGRKTGSRSRKTGRTANGSSHANA
ncbi:MAG: hypothetical protein JNM45_16515 [Rhizobiales bacterium]|nr:hypothetical protein [Hyphomicrobiales bacterium]